MHSAIHDADAHKRAASQASAISVSRVTAAVVAVASLFALITCFGPNRTLREAQNGKYQAVVVEDDQGKYWAVPTAGIERVDGAKLVVKPMTVLARGEGHGSGDVFDKEVSTQLVDLLRRSNVSGFGAIHISTSGSGYSFSGDIEVTRQLREITVIKVLHLEEKEG